MVRAPPHRPHRSRLGIAPVLPAALGVGRLLADASRHAAASRFNWTTIMPLIEAVAVTGVRSAGLDYGRVRLWGSGSFILASFGCGLAHRRLSAPPRCCRFWSLATALDDRRRHPPAARRSRGRALASPPALARRISLADAVKLAHSPSVPVPARGEHSSRQATRSTTPSPRCIGARKASPTAPSARCWALGVIAEDRVVCGLRSGHRQMGCRQRCCSSPALLAAVALGAHGLRSAALGDGAVADACTP